MKTHADARRPLRAWLATVEATEWHSPAAVRESFPRASIVRDGLLVFDIKGNDYRLAAQVSFDHQIARVVQIGTHAEYDRWKL